MTFIGLPSSIGVYAMEGWLENFTYKIDITLDFYTLTIGYTFAMLFFIVFVRSYYVIHVNPIEVLRDE